MPDSSSAGGPPGLPAANGNGNTMGLRGRWGSVANLTAVGLICVLFYQGQQEAYRQAREDRQMFREEMRQVHEDSRRQGAAIESLTESVRTLVEEVRALKRGR
jgi:hypothetical protein